MAISVSMNVKERNAHIKSQLELKGLKGVREDQNAAYCPISLTSVPEGLKGVIRERQEILKRILGDANIESYDPGTAPMSPDLSLNDDHTKIYAEDTFRVANARYFCGNLVLPSSGMGVEQELANNLNRVSVMLIDRNIRVSRMLPSRTIYLAYDNLEREAQEFSALFKVLQGYDPGFGFNNGTPALLGFRKGCPREAPVDLEEVAYEMFPDKKFVFDGSKPIVEMDARNPDVFGELR